jgi:hypothetical protein
MVYSRYRQREALKRGKPTMSDEATSVAGDAKQSVVSEKSNMTASQYAVRRLGELKVKPDGALNPASRPAEQPTSQSAPAEEEQQEQASNDQAQAEPNPTGKDVPSQVELSELSDEDIQELAQKGKSGLLKRIAELTAKRKLAEEKAAQLEAYMAQQQNSKPLEPKVENNPYASISSIEDLGKKVQEVADVVEWAEDILDRAEHLGFEDIAATVDGRELTKAQVKETLRNARKARDKFLPAQKKDIEAGIQRKGLRSAFEQQAVKELEWLATQEDNDIKRQFFAMLNDPRLKGMEEALPDVAPQLPYILAHAANSMFARKTIPMDSKPSPKLTPPGSPSSTAAAGDRTPSSGERNMKEVSKRLADSGSVSDFIALRAAQLSKRK